MLEVHKSPGKIDNIISIPLKGEVIIHKREASGCGGSAHGMWSGFTKVLPPSALKSRMERPVSVQRLTATFLKVWARIWEKNVVAWSVVLRIQTRQSSGLALDHATFPATDQRIYTNAEVFTAASFFRSMIMKN